MPVNESFLHRNGRLKLRYRLAVLLCVAILAVLAADYVWAQARNPFGVGQPAPAEAPSGFIAWVLAKQAEFHRMLIAGVRQVKEGGSAWVLVAGGFLYGAFHAVGPGHGKAIVSSYVMANEQALRRGIIISFAAAFIQACVAVVVVWLVVQVFEGAARQITQSVRWIEIASFGLIVAFGLYLVARKGLALYGYMRSERAANCAECSRFQLSYRPSSLGAAAVAMPAGACSHIVIPDARGLVGERKASELLAAAFAAGARPCTGAILILALALASDVFATGVLAVFAMALGTALATSGFAIAAGSAKSLVRRLTDGSDRWRGFILALELAAALAVTAFGLLLLAGYISGD